MLDFNKDVCESGMVGRAYVCMGDGWTSCRRENRGRISDFQRRQRSDLDTLPQY
jgi:hypothetical protein